MFVQVFTKKFKAQSSFTLNWDFHSSTIFLRPSPHCPCKFWNIFIEMKSTEQEENCFGFYFIRRPKMNKKELILLTSWFLRNLGFIFYFLINRARLCNSTLRVVGIIDSHGNCHDWLTTVKDLNTICNIEYTIKAGLQMLQNFRISSFLAWISEADRWLSAFWLIAPSVDENLWGTVNSIPVRIQSQADFEASVFISKQMHSNNWTSYLIPHTYMYITGLFCL